MQDRYQSRTAVARSQSCAMLLIAVLLAGCPKFPGSSSSTSPPPPAPHAYYVNCSTSAAGDGTQSSPWNSLAPIAAKTFQAGDQILFQRGTSCSGMLAPQGSGTSVAPIVIDAYGSGALPVINSGSDPQ